MRTSWRIAIAITFLLYGLMLLYRLYAYMFGGISLITALTIDELNWFVGPPLALPASLYILYPIIRKAMKIKVTFGD